MKLNLLMLTIDPNDPTVAFLFCPSLADLSEAIEHPDEAIAQVQASYPTIERIMLRYREFSCSIPAKYGDLV